MSPAILTAILGLLSPLTSLGGDPPAAAGRSRDPQAAQQTAEQSVDVKGDRVTLHLSGLPLADALRMLSEPTKRNIILAAGVQGVVTASMYNVTFESALEGMLVSNGLGYRTDGNFVYVYPVEELLKLESAKRKLVSRVIRLTYMNAASAKGLIEPMLSPAGKVAVTPPAKTGLGGEKGMSDTEGDSLASSDSLLVTDYEEKLKEIESVLASLDITPTQVLIEATILRATLNEDNALGIDFTTVGGVDFADVSSVSPAAQSVTTGNIPSNQLNNTNFTVRTDLNSSLPAGGFTFGILKDQVGIFVRALEQITDTEILANPKVLALNKQVGQVIVGRRDGYLTTTITETTAIQTVEFLETGTVLTFRPYVGDDGMVRMEIHPKDSTGGLTSANLPFEQTTEVTTNILVKDGHTILIGGLFREVSTATRGQVPLLGNIPILGAAFRRTRDATVREEVIVLLTVHVLKQDQDHKASKELGEDIERFRVGMRDGLQWFGRERLSEAHYRWAMEHLAEGDTDKALWDAELSLTNYPRHVEAMKLREKLLGKRAWESEATSIRQYILDRIAEENGIIKAPYGRPGPPFEMPEGFEGPSGFEENPDADEVEDAPRSVGFGNESESGDEN
jgi:type IV pilus assembly protein PilQ